MVQQFSRELSPAAEKEIWKRLNRGDYDHELLELAIADGVSPFDAERIIAEMRRASELVGEARKTPWQVRVGTVLGVFAIIMGALLFINGVSRIYAGMAIFLGITLVGGGWYTGR